MIITNAGRCSLFLALWLTASQFSMAQQDRFAQIGGQSYALRRDLLIEPGPPDVTRKTLPASLSTALPISFARPAETAETLKRELDSARNRYAPYLRDLTPLGSTGRRRLSIDSMQWRLETEQDRLDFTSTLAGKGDWKPVAIPHYGPPMGHAVAYYTREVELDEAMLGAGSLLVSFRGVDYKAEVYFNGAFVGRHEGFFAPFECDLLPHARKGKNRLLVKVINEPSTTGSTDGARGRVVGDKIYAAGGLGWNDPVDGWHLCFPGMGISQEVFIEARAKLFIHDLFVRPLLKDSVAEVWVEVYNTTKDRYDVSLSFDLLGKNFPATIVRDLKYKPETTIVPGIGDMVKPTDWERKPLSMEYGRNFLRIRIPMKDYRLWTTEDPFLYNLHASLFDVSGQRIDRQSRSFGMRSFTMDTVNIPKGNMYLNGKMIRLRGANSMGFEQNDVFKRDTAQLIDDILLGKLCNMNFFRFTQRPVQKLVYDYCDRLGMLNQTDLPFFGAIRINQFSEAVKQAEEMERLIRSHPSAIMVTYINERFPNAEGTPQRSYSDAEQIFSVFRALDQAVLLSNPDRVIKPGDGDYDPPGPGLPDNHCYNTWYNGHAMDLGKLIKGYWQLIKPGWQYGCGEFGAEGLDPVSLMRKYYPAGWLPGNATEDKAWTPARIGSSQTRTMHYMWFPTQYGLDGWVRESQQFQAWAVGLMAEAFRRDARNVSSAVHLFIDAWPAGWMKAIMDVDRQPKPAFYAYRNALAPLMVSLRTDQFAWKSVGKGEVELWVCNDRNDIPSGTRLGYEVSVEGRVMIREMISADIASNAPKYQGTISFVLPKLTRRATAVVRVGLFDAAGNCLHVNTREWTVFPETPTPKNTGYAFGEDAAAATLLQETKLAPAKSMSEAGTVFISNYAVYDQNRTVVDAFVRSGGTVIFSEIPQGKYKIDTSDIEVTKTIMGEYYFANPEFELMRRSGLRDKDLFMWYDRKVGYIQPLLRNVFRAPGWDALVSTGLCNFAGADPSGYLAIAERRIGKGRFVFSEVTLAGRMADNPAAGQLMKSLIAGNR